MELGTHFNYKRRVIDAAKHTIRRFTITLIKKRRKKVRADRRPKSTCLRFIHHKFTTQKVIISPSGLGRKKNEIGNS